MHATLTIRPHPSEAEHTFGPFAGAFSVGSAAGRNQVVLAGPDVAPSHLTITPYASGVLGVTPAPGANTWFQLAGEGHAHPLTSAVQLQPGDVLCLGSPNGPRARLGLSAARQPSPSRPAASAAPSLPYASSGSAPSLSQRPDLASQVGRELARQSTARLLGRVGPVREAYYLWTRLRGGSLTSPTVIASVLITLVTAVAGGGLSCTGLASALWWRWMHH